MMIQGPRRIKRILTEDIPHRLSNDHEDQVSFDHGELSSNYWARKVGLSNKYKRPQNHQLEHYPQVEVQWCSILPHEKAEHKHLGPRFPKNKKTKHSKLKEIKND